MESSRRDFLNNMVEQMPILKNNQNMSHPRFGFIHGKKWFCYGNKIRDNKWIFYCFNQKILLQQPNVLLTELNILLL